MAGTVRERLIRQLVQQVECICGRQYKPENFRLLARSDQLWFFRAFCPRCRTTGVIGILVAEGQPLIRDVSKKEWRQFQKKGPITADEVLDLHLFLKDYHGDLATLIQASDKRGQSSNDE